MISAILPQSNCVFSAPHASGRVLPPSATDSIETAPPTPPIYKPSKPALPEVRVIRALEKVRQVGHHLVDTHMSAIQRSQSDLQELHKANLEKLHQAAARSQTGKMWDLLKHIGGFILGAISTVLGISLVSTGAGSLVGGVLIASGIVQIANLVLDDLGAWDWIAQKLAHDNEEKREKIARVLPAIVGVLSAASGLAGSAAACFWIPVNGVQQVMALATSAVSIVEGSAAAGKGLSEAQTFFLQGDLTILQNEMSKKKSDIEKISGQIHGVLEEQANLYGKAKKIIQESVRVHSLLTSMG
jgi:uncharacterized protein YoxC